MTKTDHQALIVHYLDIQRPDTDRYANSTERLSIGSAFSAHFQFQRLGIHHEVLPPGRRTSYPHAEKTEEEFVYVIEGTPDVWINGHLYRLRPGDGVGFRPGTGIAHSFLNNTETDVRLLVVGEKNRADNQIHYPLNPEENIHKGHRWWRDAPPQELGPHDGLPLS
jgi:uncharacterized cupin superfamily protein